MMLVTLFCFFWMRSVGQTTQFDQAQNDAATPFSISWTNGILNNTQTTYYEGVGTPQRLFISGIAGGTHSITIKHLAESGGTHAYDFIMSWAQAKQTAINIGGNGANELQNLDAAMWLDAPFDLSANLSSATKHKTASVDVTNFGSPSSITTGRTVDQVLTCWTGIYGAPYIDIVGNQDISSVTISAVPGYDADYKSYIITWTSNSTQLLVYFAGHPAMGLAIPSSCGYGQNLGAGAISGGNYHIKLTSFDDASIGDRDNQIMSSAFEIPPPPCTITPSTASYCQGGTATFNGPAGMDNYAWSISPNTGATLTASGATATVTSNTPGTYTITLVTTISSVQSTDNCQATLTVYGKPNCSITGNNIICSGSTTSFSGPAGMSSYAWTGPGGFSVSTQSTGNISTAGTYTLTITNSNGCSSTCTRVLTVNQSPTVAVNSPSVCPANLPATITATPTPSTPAAGVYTYTWQVPGGATNPGNVASFPASIAGTYTVTVIDGNGCTGSGAGTLTVYGAATLSATATPATINMLSADHNSVLNAYGSVNGVQNNALFSSFTWSAITVPPFSNGTSGLSSTSGATVTFTANAFNDQYKFLVTGTTLIGSCTATATVIITTGGSFICPGITGPGMLCAGSSGTFTATGSLPQYTHYNWSAQGASISGSTHDVTSVIVTPSAGTYTVSIAVSFDNISLGTVTCTTTATAVDCSLSGCTIGYWKNHPAVWDAYTDPVVAGLVSGTTTIYPGMPAGTGPGQQFTTATLFKTYFAITQTITGISGNPTMLQVLGLQGGNCVALARNGIAALLSKAAFGDSYPFSGSFIDLYNTIRTVLNGGTSTWTCSSLNDALNIANNNEFNGNCSALGSPGATPKLLKIASSDKDLLVNKLNVIAAPNPFNSRVKFFISSPESGHVHLDVLNMLGQRIATVYDGNVQANNIQEVEFNAPASAPQNMMYLLRMGNKQVTGKLLRVNY